MFVMWVKREIEKKKIRVVNWILKKQNKKPSNYQVSSSPAASAESFGHSADQALVSMVDLWDHITLKKKKKSISGMSVV